MPHVGGTLGTEFHDGFLGPHGVDEGILGLRVEVVGEHQRVTSFELILYELGKRPVGPAHAGVGVGPRLRLP